MAETSDVKFLNVAGKHLTMFKAAGARWNHPDSALSIVNLQKMLDEGYPVAENVFSKVAPFNIVINNRQAAYAKIDPTVRASRRYLKSTSATTAEIADINTIINKLLAPSGRKKETLDPNKPAAEVEQGNSTSHRSYDARQGNLIALRHALAALAAYDTNETNINIAAYDALIAEIEAANQAVNDAYAEAFNAWNKRDAKLYDDSNSILEIFRRAKEYYKSLFEPKSPEYKAITAKAMTLDSNSRSRG